MAKRNEAKAADVAKRNETRAAEAIPPPVVPQAEPVVEMAKQRKGPTTQEVRERMLKICRMPKRSMAQKSGLIMPVVKFKKALKKGNFAHNIGNGAAVYMAAVLEYLVAELLELSGNAATDNKKMRIIPRHLQLAIRNDIELNKLLQSVTISQGGVMPFIHTVLLPKATLRNNSTNMGSED